MGFVLLHITNDDQLMEKNGLILWKVSSIQWTWNELNLNSIEDKQDMNWYKRHWKYSCDYGVRKK